MAKRGCVTRKPLVFSMFSKFIVFFLQYDCKSDFLHVYLPQEMVKRFFENSDKIGAWSSMLCLVHCATFPVLMGFYPFLHLAEPIEMVFLTISVFAVLVSVYNSVDRRSNEVRVMITALIVLLGSIFLEEKHEAFRFISFAAAISLAIAHYLSIRKQKACKL